MTGMGPSLPAGAICPGDTELELRQVRYFLALCRTLNLTRAAETCNVTQPALTRAIQRLEDEPGVALLPRHVNLLAGLLARPVADAGDLRAIVLAAVNGRRYSPALDGFLKLNRARAFAAPAPGTRIPPAQAAAASASAGANSQ